MSLSQPEFIEARGYAVACVLCEWECQEKVSLVIVCACVMRVISTSSTRCVEDAITIVARYEGGRGSSDVFAGDDGKVGSVEGPIGYNDDHSLAVVWQLRNRCRERDIYGIECVTGYG